jgi:Holliday junction resolvase RusA-like endonuclease
VYMPPEHRAWMDAAVSALRGQYLGVPIPCPVSVEIVAYWTTPKARPRWCKLETWRNREATSGIPYATKPDADNVSKMVLDALVDAGILVDDAIVVELNVLKRAIQEAARIEVWIEER